MKTVFFVLVGILIGVIVVGVMVMNTPSVDIITTQKTNEKIGLVINSPNQSTTLQDIDKIYSQQQVLELAEVMSISFGI